MSLFVSFKKPRFYNLKNTMKHNYEEYIDADDYFMKLLFYSKYLKYGSTFRDIPRNKYTF